MRSAGIHWGVRRFLFFLFTVIIVCVSGSHALSVQREGVCVSQGGQFPKFSLEGLPPRKSTKGAIDLTLCRVYRKKTCCDVVQTHAALLSLQRLATGGEASKGCLESWEVMECSICDPRVGVTPGPPLLCPSFCESLFSACLEAFFSTEPLTQVLSPCGPKDVLCAKAQEWASNSSAFCQLAGFSVMDSAEHVHTLEEKACFDGKVESAGSVDDVKNTNPKNSRRAQHYSAMDMLRNWMENMNIAEQVMWAIGGLVLTGGALHLRRRNLVKRSAASTVLRNKLLHEEARARQQALYKVSATSSGSRKEKTHVLKASSVAAKV